MAPNDCQTNNNVLFDFDQKYIQQNKMNSSIFSQNGTKSYIP